MWRPTLGRFISSFIRYRNLVTRNLYLNIYSPGWIRRRWRQTSWRPRCWWRFCVGPHSGSWRRTRGHDQTRTWLWKNIYYHISCIYSTSFWRGHSYELSAHLSITTECKRNICSSNNYDKTIVDNNNTSITNRVTWS